MDFMDQSIEEISDEETFMEGIIIAVKKLDTPADCQDCVNLKIFTM